jgi:hypothetical protein
LNRQEILLKEALQEVEVLQKKLSDKELAPLQNLLKELQKQNQEKEKNHHYFQDGFFRIIRLFSDFKIIPENPELFYHSLLGVALFLIPEAELGTMSLVEDGKWRFVAAIGHDLGQLLRMDLKADWDLAREEIQMVNNTTGISSHSHKNMPNRVRRRFAEALEPTDYSLLGAVRIGETKKLSLCLDIPRGSSARFSSQSLEIFRSLLNLAGTYYRLVANREELAQSYQLLMDNHISLERSAKEVQELSGKLTQVLDLAGRLGNEYYNLDSFYHGLLETALNVVGEADYGSLGLIDGDDFRYLAAVGHDLRKLMTLELKTQYMVFSDTPMVCKDIVYRKRKGMPKKLLDQLSEASKPLKSSLTITERVDDQRKICLTLDIARGNEKEYKETSIKAFQDSPTWRRVFTVPVCGRKHQGLISEFCQ